jgi:hypothetical protein
MDVEVRYCLQYACNARAETLPNQNLTSSLARSKLLPTPCNTKTPNHIKDRPECVPTACAGYSQPCQLMRETGSELVIAVN